MVKIRAIKRKERYKQNTKKIPVVGDIWFASCPFNIPGDTWKPRPVLIREINDDELKVQMITSKPKGKLIEDSKHFAVPSYLTNKYITIKETNLIRRIRSKYDRTR